MKTLSAAVFALILHSYEVGGVNPTFEELQSQLPINLTQNGTDQYFFFIVPVQKRDDPNVILQMAQVQSATNNTNSSVASTMIDTLHLNGNVSASGEDLNLGEFFSVPESEEDGGFNFQVPVVVPLDFRFTYDRASADTALPECSVDSRTWKEKVISRIAEKLELDGRPSWDHSELNLRIRLVKDGLASLTLNHITTLEELSTFVSAIQKTKNLADIRYHYVINNITKLTGDHVSLMAEGVDTYDLLIRCIKIAEDGIGKFSGDNSNNFQLATYQTQITEVKPSAEETLAKFRKILFVTKDLQRQEAKEAVEGI